MDEEVEEQGGLVQKPLQLSRQVIMLIGNKVMTGIGGVTWSKIFEI